jgi:hypothetical protein
MAISAVSLVADPDIRYYPFETSLTISITATGSITWFIDFDDGSPRVTGSGTTVPVQTHTYTTPGIRTPFIEVTDGSSIVRAADIVTVLEADQHFVIRPEMEIYVDLNRSTDGHAGTFRDNLSANDLQALFDFLALRQKGFDEQLTFICRGRAVKNFVLHDLVGEEGNLIKFTSSDPVNDPATFVYDESTLDIE